MCGDDQRGTPLRLGLALLPESPSSRGLMHRPQLEQSQQHLIVAVRMIDMEYFIELSDGSRIPGASLPSDLEQLRISDRNCMILIQCWTGNGCSY